MSLRKLNSLLLVAALFVAAVSCKDDDETETLPELSGLRFDCPSFVAPGQAVPSNRQKISVMQLSSMSAILDIMLRSMPIRYWRIWRRICDPLRALLPG